MLITYETFPSYYDHSGIGPCACATCNMLSPLCETIYYSMVNTGRNDEVRTRRVHNSEVFCFRKKKIETCWPVTDTQLTSRQISYL